MSDDRFRVCDGCALEWRGDAPCWACGRAGVVQQRSHFAGADVARRGIRPVHGNGGDGMSDETPDWLHVGAKVAAVRNDRSYRSYRSVTRATVTKIGKRDVVLDDGQRFPVRTLTRHEGGTWGWAIALMSADDPRVAKLSEEIRQARRVAAARDACRRFIDRDGTVTAFDVILALAPLTGVADEIAALDKVSS